MSRLNYAAPVWRTHLAFILPRLRRISAPHRFFGLCSGPPPPRRAGCAAYDLREGPAPTRGARRRARVAERWGAAVLTTSCLCIAAAHARADVSVDTAYQSWGIAPRLEFEFGPQFAWGIGHACRNEPALQGIVPTRSCTSGFPLLGAQLLALVRPFNHWALGPLYAFDAVLGAYDVSVSPGENPEQSSYSRSSQRLAVAVRWYSRGVAASGLYVTLHAGALWWSDSIQPVADSVTQLAPQFGVELGGVFAPYRGPGVTLGLQAWLAWLRSTPQRSMAQSGSTYGYGPFVFVGVTGRFELGLNL